MKQSEVKPGVRALFSLGGTRGNVAVTVLSLRWHRPATWLVRDSSGQQYNATPRQLRPLPVTDASGKLIGYAGADGGTYPAIAGKRSNGLSYVSAEPGQTIDLGDSVIETTLHRLG